MTDKEIFFEVLHKAREFKAAGRLCKMPKGYIKLLTESYALGYYEALHRRDDERP